MRKPKAHDETEAWVKKQVRQILADTGWTFWMPSSGIYGRSGVSDFLAVKKPALFMAIETKYNDVVTSLQFRFLTDVHDAGHYALLVDETNIDELRKLLTYDIGVLPMYDSDVCRSLMKWRDQSLTGEKS